MSDREKKIKLIKENVREYPDFPKQGVIFRDIFSVLQKPALFADLRDILTDMAREVPNVDCIVGLDARGFLFAPLIALELKLPFVPVRKKGKLPGKTVSHTYQLEYGEDTVQIQADAVKKGQKVLLIDDLLATGGTLSAACSLVSKVGATVVASVVVIELSDLKGRDKLSCKVLSVLSF